jgi:hypothetical protein
MSNSQFAPVQVSRNLVLPVKDIINMFENPDGDAMVTFYDHTDNTTHQRLSSYDLSTMVDNWNKAIR